MALLFIVGCAKKDDLAIGTYKDRTYRNSTFNINMEIEEGFSFLTAEELQKANELNQKNNDNPEQAKFQNKVLEISNVDKVSLIAYVDATPDVYKNADAEGNKLLDFLGEQRIAYTLEKEDAVINGLEYKRLNLGFDFNQNQIILYAVADDKLINIQITYPDGHEDTANQLVMMLDSNE